MFERRRPFSVKRLVRLVSELSIRYRARDLDPIFYFNHYDDLKIMKSISDLRKHYAFHGRKEARYPNLQAYQESRKREILQSPDSFDLVAYRYYNKDLLSHLTHDDEFIDHYIRHGLAEGRRCRFDVAETSKDAWQSAFSCAQVLAWCGNRLPDQPANKRDLLKEFKQIGVDEGWPVNFDCIFDPDFYRSEYQLPPSVRLSDSRSYKHFLEEGFPRGHAPNESTLLYPYLGGAPYPDQFNWMGYAKAVGMSGKVTRISALSHLFTAGHRDFSSIIEYLGANAAEVLGSVGKFALIRNEFETAVAALVAACSIQSCSDLACLLGDAYRGLGKTEEALAAYRRSVAIGSAPIWSYFHCIEISSNQKDFDSAFEMLRQAWEPWRHKVAYYEMLERCIDLYFQHRSAEAHRLYRRGIEAPATSEFRRNADELLRVTLEVVKNLYSELDVLPAKTGGLLNGYVAILANDDLRQCAHYRVEQKVLQFQEIGIPVRVFSHHDVDGFMGSLVGARAAIFYRVAATPNVLRAILHASSMGLMTYYEIDDLIFDPLSYPDPFSSFEDQISIEEYTGLQFGVPLFRYAMSMCDVGIASTRPLARRMEEVTKSGRGVVLLNGLDGRNNLAIQIGAQARESTGRIRVFYGSGTKAHNADFNELIGPVLLALMERYSNVDLVIVGHLRLRPDLAALRDRVFVYPVISDVNAYWSLLASCDINLAVLHAGPVADCKSEIKWLEAAVFQIPSIVSETAAYRDALEDGVHGLLASSSCDWLRHLERLIESEDSRRRLGSNARSLALSVYGLSAGAETLRSTFDIGKQNITRSNRKSLRVLICNVFFSPQSIGGATRVVEDNIRSFRKLYDDLEIGVFCSDEGVTPPGRLRMGSWDGIPVYRLSTPLEEGMDSRPFNDANAVHFRRVLDHFKPDIIHFHCIQRLTASIVEVALQSGIPYLVTLHDGWWISDSQFLVDHDGFLKLPTKDVFRDSKDHPRPTESIERRQRLATLLRGAAARLSVSSAFARIYEDAGIRDLQVTENGVSPIAPARRLQRADGRLALGHIGGRSAHKGAFLIEAAFRQEAFSHLHLTMIDGTLPPGRTIETLWGTTPVMLCGPYPQSRIAELYGQLDVLLAPSTWPESYGLVTREALSLGLWVVASDLGAIGEAIEHGRNGYLINTDTSTDLKKVLHKLDGMHDYYRRPPEASSLALRSMEAQAVELHEMYWEIARHKKANFEHSDQSVTLSRGSG